MVITVTTASQSLATIMSTAQKTGFRAARTSGSTGITIQNLGGQDIYIEIGATATVAGGFKVVKTSGEVSFFHNDASLINLIADGGSNANVRLLISGSE